MLDWGTPTSMDKYLDFDDYVNGYLDTYVEYIKNQASCEKISLQGYCTGATIATAYTSTSSRKCEKLHCNSTGN